MPKRNFEELRERMLKAAKEGISKAYESEEYALMQAINAYMETSRSYNLNFERLSEWYGIYFPEVRVGNPNTLSALIIAMDGGANPSREAIEEALKDKEAAESIYKKVSGSIGRKMNGEEAQTVVRFAKLSSDMAALLDNLDAYIGAASKRLLPNTTYLTEPKIAAELLSRAGSMERLATMPAGTVQLLGAEKALFKHIKFGSRPPKYGVLFKLPEIGTAPREIRGKIARVYATKICIALKADYFSKNFIAEKLKKDLDLSIKRIKEKPVREKKPYHEPERFRGNQGRLGRPERQGGWRKNFKNRG